MNEEINHLNGSSSKQPKEQKKSKLIKELGWMLILWVGGVITLFAIVKLIKIVMILVGLTPPN